MLLCGGFASTDRRMIHNPKDQPTRKGVRQSEEKLVYKDLH